MAGAPKKKQVQRVTIEIKGGPKKADWTKFKAAVSKALKSDDYRSVKAKIVEIAYVVKRLDRR
jgi:hypothetical protein